MYKCNYCGQGPGKIINPVGEDDYRLMCPRCAQALNTCNFCTNAVTCAFESDPSPIPKQVAQTIRQGNMTMQTVIRNPERVKAFCFDCTCFNEEELLCRRENGWCSSYNEYIPSPRIDDNTFSSAKN